MKHLFLLFGIFLFTVGCEKDDPHVPHEEELITTVKLIFTPTDGGSPVEFIFKDLDGDGAKAPEITNGKLKPNTTYTAKISLLNELESPAHNITKEVEEESGAHQLFYIVDSSLKLAATYTDKDSKNFPIGLQMKFQTFEASNGNLTVILKHEPNKSASGVSDGKLDNAGGETDIQATFNVTIE